MDLGANINQQDKASGWTSLMQVQLLIHLSTQATFYGHCHVVAALLKGGADPAVRAFNGCTALDLATLVDSDSECRLVRLLATHTIEAEPPGLLLARGRAGHNRSISTGGTSQTAGTGGLWNWWSKFSGRCCPRPSRAQVQEAESGDGGSDGARVRGSRGGGGGQRPSLQ